MNSTSGDASSGADDRVVRDQRGTIRGVRALEDINFTVSSGDRLALIGHNGAGKTTLLRLLAGIIAPDTGSITTEGRLTNLINVNLGMQMEATGHRNITLRGIAAGHSKPQIEEKRAEIVEFSELGDFLDMPLNTYSAGMRTRLSFAIATAFDPEILILDEWISAGDAAFRNKAVERMHRFAEQAGILVLASHSRSLLTKNCSRAIWLDHGRIRESGPVDDVLNAYIEAVEAEKATAKRSSLEA